jgi:uncharacterized protein
MPNNKVIAAPKRETRSFKLSAQPIEIRTAADGTKTISGIAAPFNKRSVDLGGFVEIIAPGTFKRTLVQNPDVLALRDHTQSILLGRTKSGTLTLTESPEGLRFTCKLPNTSQAADLAESLARGDIDSCSFGFVTVKDDWSVDADGTVVRTLQDVDLFEISVVSFPAYPDSTAALRSCPVALRSRLKAEDEDDSDCDPETDDGCEDEEERCACDCSECLSGACDECSDDDCDDELCSTCPNQDESRSDRMRLRSLFAHRMTV